MTSRAVLAVAGLALSACASAPPPGFEPISTPGAFVDMVAGREMTFPNGVLIANGDVTFSGDFGGETPSGDWEFTGGEFWRTLAIGAQAFPRTCNRLEAKPDAVRFFNPDGTLSAEAGLD